jgi:hypothetical protein
MSAAPARQDYGSAVAASLIAEGAFVALTMGLMAARGNDPWKPTRASASLVFGPEVARPAGFVPGGVALGLGMHVAYSVVAGGAYAALRPRLGLSPVPAGLVTGGVVYALGSFIVPAALGSWVEPMKKSKKEKGMAALTHAFYGVVFGLANDRLSRRRKS